MKEPIEVRLDGVLVLKERLPDRLGSYGAVQGFLARLKLGHTPLRRLVEDTCFYCPHKVGKALLNVPALLLKAREIVRALVVLLVVFGRVHSD